jgi:hypothetical protein
MDYRNQDDNDNNESNRSFFRTYGESFERHSPRHPYPPSATDIEVQDSNLGLQPDIFAR